jgi:hypothetical protein
MTPPGAPTASDITVKQTIELLDGDFKSVAEGVANGRYVFWLGSGISTGSVPGLTGVVQKVLEFLQTCADLSNPDCAHHRALSAAIKLTDLRPDERAALDLASPVESWTHLAQIIASLEKRYSELLDIRVEGEPRDYLLWNALDVRNTYPAGAQPGCEHVCLAILSLEGVVSDIPSANWDGLIESAVGELAQDPDQILRVVVLAEDFRDPQRRTRLLKFHGCALLAANDETKYRGALGGAQSQITDWPNDNNSKLMATALQTLATTKPTLMIGLSAQDTDIQDVFSKAKGLMPWSWRTEPPAHVFAEEQLGDMQRNLLKVVYRDEYERHGQEIEKGALVRAYAKPLLTALVLYVLTAKLRAFIDTVEAPGIDKTGRDTLGDGLKYLRDRLAEHGEPDHLAFVRSTVRAETRVVSLFQTGTEPTVTDTSYRPLSADPAEQIAGEASLATTGMREMAAALGLLGSGSIAGAWEVTVGPTASGRNGALKVATTTTTGESAIYFAANGRAAAAIEASSTVTASADDVVMIHSTEPVHGPARSAHSRFGRTGSTGIRHVDMCHLLSTSRDLAELESLFRQSAAL